MVNSILVKIFTDGDSAMFHPQTGERLTSDCESYYFYISNPIEFINNLLSNNFKMSEETEAFNDIHQRLSSGSKKA